MDGKVDLLADELAAAGMNIDRRVAGELISERVRAVAAALRVTEQTARTYFTEESVREMARSMLFEVVDEQPGADLLALPRTVALPPDRAGMVVAALAEAMQIAALNEPPDQLTDLVATYGQMLSAVGQMIAAPRKGGDPDGIMFPPALLRRVARYLGNVADLVEGGGRLQDGLAEGTRGRLAATLRLDADRLIAAIPKKQA